MVRTLSRILILFFVCTLECAAQSRSQQKAVSAQSSSKTQAPAANAQATPAAAGLDFPKLQSEAVLWLQSLIRINTTNPPGNELTAAKFIADILQKEGITAEVFESTPGRGIVVARLSSSAVPDPARALLLMG